MVIVITAIY